MSEHTEHTPAVTPGDAPAERASAFPADQAPAQPGAAASCSETVIPPDTAAAPVTPMEPVDEPPESGNPAPDGKGADPSRFSTANVKRTLKSLGIGLVFLLVLALILFGASRIFEPKNNGGVGGVNAAHAAAEGFLGEPDESLDVLFFGDSETYSAVSPVQIWKDTGIAGYTCAIGKQYLTYSKSLMEKALAKHHPKVVVVEGNQLFRAFDEQKLVKSIIKDLFPIFERHDRWKALTPQDFVAAPENTWIDDTKGFRMKWGQRAASTEGYMAPSDAQADVPELTEAVLAEMVEACRANGTELVIAATPSTKNWSTARHNATVALAERLGVDFIDLNTGDDQVIIDWDTDTRDYGDHLNYYGATKTSKALAQILRERYGLPDHRGEAGYETWERAVRHYDRQAEEGESWVNTCLAPLTTDLRATLPLEGNQLP